MPNKNNLADKLKKAFDRLYCNARSLDDMYLEDSIDIIYKYIESLLTPQDEAVKEVIEIVDNNIQVCEHLVKEYSDKTFITMKVEHDRNENMLNNWWYPIRTALESQTMKINALEKKLGSP